jgi:putative membrane protein
MSATPDQKFAENAAAGSAAEIQLGQLAADKATNDKVKQFGQRMVTDHTKASSELKTLAAKKGMTIPDSPKGKDKAKFEKLSKMSGPAFDKAYMQDMVKDHQKDVAEFQKEANSGSDPDLKAWAATTLPVLQEHLRMAKETLSAVNGSGGSAGAQSTSR